VATIAVDGDWIVVRLSALERLGAFVISEPRGRVEDVREVRVSDTPWKELRGVRAPGTGLPGAVMLGTLRFSGGRDFAAVYGKSKKAVVVEFEGGRYGRFVVTNERAEELAATIAAVAGSDHPRAQ
jgi:hypothetical protein